jgi:branched-chain amino acid aminotransferase
MTSEPIPQNLVYLNGSLVPDTQAAISAFDSGFLHGASTFTTMLAHNGVIFRFDRHMERLMDTVKLLGLRVAVGPEDLRRAACQVLEANQFRQARMRITLTSGGVRGSDPVVLVTAEPLAGYPSEWYELGIGVIVTAFKQFPGDPTFGYKTGCYLPRILARQEAASKGAEEALWFTTENHLAEACFNNVFLVMDGRVLTPPRDTPVLPGIVRQAVLELCGQLGIDFDDATPLGVHEMLGAQEIFLTGSTTGIRPVVRVEGHGVGDEKPGPVTRSLMEAYRQLLDKECVK